MVILEVNSLQEDAHICNPNFESDSSLFGVFDGHGGIEVAMFTSRHFQQEFLTNTNYAKQNYELALQETFLKMDELLGTAEGRKELIQISREFPAQQSPLERALTISGAGVTKSMPSPS